MPRVRLTIQERNENLESFLHPDLVSHQRVTIQKYQNKTFKRGLGEDDTPFPVIEQLGPYIVKNPIIAAKNYYWCSCGMSQKQPFCDGSHEGTMFKPLKFNLEEKVNRMYLCGCKISRNAPFCDGVACQKLLKGEAFEYVADPKSFEQLKETARERELPNKQ